MDRIDLDEEIKDKLLIGFVQGLLSESKFVKNVFNTAIFNDDEEGKRQSLETIRKYKGIKSFYIELAKKDPCTCRYLLKHNINYFSRDDKEELLKGLCKDKKILLESITKVDFTFNMQRVIFDNYKEDEEVMNELCRYAFNCYRVDSIDEYSAKLGLKAEDKKILRQYAIIFKLGEGGN